MEWDNFTELATAVYNFVPNVSSKESPFFLMFGRDPYMPLNKLLSQAMRYLGTDKGIPNLEALQNLLFYFYLIYFTKLLQLKLSMQLQKEIRVSNL